MEIQGRRGKRGSGRRLLPRPSLPPTPGQAEGQKLDSMQGPLPSPQMAEPGPPSRPPHHAGEDCSHATLCPPAQGSRQHLPAGCPPRPALHGHPKTLRVVALHGGAFGPAGHCPTAQLSIRSVSTLSRAAGPPRAPGPTQSSSRKPPWTKPSFKEAVGQVDTLLPNDHATDLGTPVNPLGLIACSVQIPAVTQGGPRRPDPHFHSLLRIQT